MVGNSGQATRESRFQYASNGAAVSGVRRRCPITMQLERASRTVNISRFLEPCVPRDRRSAPCQAALLSKTNLGAVASPGLLERSRLGPRSVVRPGPGNHFFQCLGAGHCTAYPRGRSVRRRVIHMSHLSCFPADMPNLDSPARQRCFRQSPQAGFNRPRRPCRRAPGT